MRVTIRLFLVVTALARAHATYAQGEAFPLITEETIAETAATLRAPTDDEVNQILKERKLTGQVGVPAAGAGPASPKLQNLPVPVDARTVDFADVAKGYGEPLIQKLRDEESGKVPSLLICVSFSMPRKTLQALIDQAAGGRGTLVIRGLVDGSVRKTFEETRTLIGSKKVGFLIDPRVFDAFGISDVPTFVVTDGKPPTSCETSSCQGEGQFVKVSGDVSVEYALEYIERVSPAFADKARYLRGRRGG